MLAAATLAMAAASGGLGPTSDPCRDPERPRAVRVACEYDTLAAQPLWPGFAPATVPLAIFDGLQTWLFDHPRPPESCDASRYGVPRTLVCPGRHESVWANNAVELNGVMTATLMLADQADERAQAATAIHEAFHAFQAVVHPGWGGNEAELFVYPFDDAAAWALQRLESDALVRALRAASDAEAVAWAKVALDRRRERFARLPAAASSYERGGELKEGLAQYVEDRALGADAARRWPADGFGAEDIRQRVYASGQALATLLDRVDAGWRSRLDAKGEATLDGLLERALAGRSEPAAALAPADESATRSRASRDIEALRASRRSAREAFEARPGPALEIEATSSPLWPQGFDPLNVRTLGRLEVLHTRFVKLGNDSGSVEAIGHESLTDGVGPHPLFAGVKRLRVRGLAAAPRIERDGDVVVVSADGVSGRFRRALVEHEGATVRVRLEAEAPRPRSGAPREARRPAGPPHEGELLGSGQALDPQLEAQRARPVAHAAGPRERHRQARAGVLRGTARPVLVQSTRDVQGRARVQRAVAAAQDVDEGHGR